MSRIEKYTQILKEKNIDFVPDWTSKKDIREIPIPFVCENSSCSKPFTITFRWFLQRRNYLCKECAPKSEELKNRKKETWKKTLNVDNPAKSPKVQEKMRNTNIDLRGVPHALQSEEVKNKIRRTNMKNRGVDWVTKDPEVKAKARKTNMKKYGVENALQSEEVKAKMRDTLRERYGVDNPMKSDIVKAKGIQTVRERYGCDNVMHCPEIFERCLRNARKFKKLTLPSGKEVYFQGYEDWVIQYLLKIGFTEDDIYIERKNIPSFFYENQSGNLHKYYPDIYLKTQNTIIEVKSEYTFQVDEEKINSCRKVVEASGFKYEVWVVDKENECHWIM